MINLVKKKKFNGKKTQNNYNLNQMIIFKNYILNFLSR